MRCPTCGKESTNLRVCGFCQTPYPADEPGKAAAPKPARATSSRAAAGDSRRHIAGLSRAKRLGILGVLAAITAGSYFVLHERTIPVGVAIPNLIAAPMAPAEAAATLAQMNAAAQIEVRNGELSVRISAATFPQRRDGQLALAQQYARADEIVHGSKRPIRFLDPAGVSFAEADVVKGVFMTR